MGRGNATILIVCVLVASVVDSIPILQDGDTGRPLYLTPFVEDGRVMEARDASRVPSMIEGDDVESYAGYITINKQFESNMFFWFFPAENNRHNAPVVLWLQGGPGASSLYATFYENGPFYITQDLKLERRGHYWSQELNMIYIDNPVGTGFSYTNDDKGYATDETDVGGDLYEALSQFFQLFPEYRRNGFFISGESYAGKYIPALAHTIHEKNPTADEKINLKGIAIGDGLVDPRNMMVYSEYLYQHGLIDDNLRATVKEIEQNTVKLIDDGNYYNATVETNRILALMSNISGPIDVYDYLLAGFSLDNEVTTAFLNQSEVRRSLHVGSLVYNNGEYVASKLYEDNTKSVAPWLEELMDEYRVLLYNGQLDIICAYPLTINFVKQLKWSGAADYLKAPRKQWHVGTELAGFAKTVGNFTEVLVRNAGHMVPADQPAWALDLITRFTQNIPFDRPLGV
uniref:Carboxypeptidase n=2 Tax=Lygus hesperus TaxID=30085 RepID=A0A0A9XDE9_LYGHE